MPFPSHAALASFPNYILFIDKFHKRFLITHSGEEEEDYIPIHDSTFHDWKVNLSQPLRKRLKR